MKSKITITIAIFLLISISIFSQSYKVKGTITDTIGEPLVGATVVLLTANDSLLTYFTSTDDKGEFIIKSIAKGKYIFQSSFTSYKKFEEPIDLTTNNRSIDKGKIKLEKTAYKLKSVEIQGERVPVQFVNDTLIYDALAFDPGKNTTVEELLRKMPGIEVDEKGDIKAQGKKVEKVTVDGKEFFGNDPKMATQNLPAEAVKKVKVFDKKSDFAEATGIKDGKEKKTIDIELKEDHKNGVFGKLTAGYGTANTYLGKASINRFSPKLRVSLIGKTNNTSKEGFDFNDLAKMSGGFNELFQSSDGSTYTFSGDFGQKEGIYKVLDGGINLNYSPSKKIDLNTSYFINSSDKNVIKNYSKQNFIPGFTYKTQSNTSQLSSIFMHNINTILKYKMNKNNKFKMKFQYKNNSSESESNDTLSNLDEQNLGNYQEGNNLNDYTGNNILSYITFNTKFKKEGRAIFTKFSGNYLDNTGFNNTNLFNQYYKDSLQLETDSIYQEHKKKTNNLKFAGSIAYTEPIWKLIYLIADLKQEFSTNSYDRNLYNKFPIQGEDTNRQDIYDSRFNHSDAKLSFKYNGIRHQLDVGLKYQYSTQIGDYLSENTDISRKYKHWLPSINYNYKISQNSSFNIRYNSKIKAPTILQLMPIVDNSNPQYIVLGNDKLEPEKSNDLNLHYNNYNSFNGTSLWISLSGSLVENTISYSKNIDNLFRTISKPINLGKSERAHLYSSYRMPIKLFKSSLSFGINGSYNHNNTLLNDIKNSYYKYDYGFSADIHNYKNKYITGRIGIKYNNTITEYSVSKNSNSSFNRIRYFANVKWKITKSIKLNNLFKYRIYSNQLSDINDKEVLWDASILFFLQDKRYTIKLSAIDILNQGLGYKQSSGDNYIQYTKTNRIGRYFMLSLTYSLSKFKGPKEGGVFIIND